MCRWRERRFVVYYRWSNCRSHAAKRAGEKAVPSVTKSWLRPMGHSCFSTCLPIRGDECSVVQVAGSQDEGLHGCPGRHVSPHVYVYMFFLKYVHRCVQPRGPPNHLTLPPSLPNRIYRKGVTSAMANTTISGEAPQRKLCIDDFQTISIIGRGAFGEVGYPFFPIFSPMFTLNTARISPLFANFIPKITV